MRIFAYSVVISRTFWAPPHISAQSATVARWSTRAGAGPGPGAEQRPRVHGRVREGHLAELARLVHRRQERDARARGPPRDEEEAHAVLRARGPGPARGGAG